MESKPVFKLSHPQCTPGLDFEKYFKKGQYYSHHTRIMGCIALLCGDKTKVAINSVNS